MPRSVPRHSGSTFIASTCEWETHNWSRSGAEPSPAGARYSEPMPFSEHPSPCDQRFSHAVVHSCSATLLNCLSSRGPSSGKTARPLALELRRLRELLHLEARFTAAMPLLKQLTS